MPRLLAVGLIDRRFPSRADVSAIESIPVPTPFTLDVYWVRISGTEGPAASLFLSGEEILRFDCLRERAHLHYASAEIAYWGGEGRVYFGPGALEDHVRRAEVELAENVRFALALNRRRAVRTAKIDREAFREAAETMGAAMRRQIDGHRPPA